jgi:hypothetical protein
MERRDSWPIVERMTMYREAKCPIDNIRQQMVKCAGGANFVRARACHFLVFSFDGVAYGRRGCRRNIETRLLL